ncbi:CDP-alcohol phosphatidyltransferase family protein [Paraflavitalea pollutisoli]|uniref:CDP-alcohol phosphatidyltransferase family protein n=1 Tax=Paraflavitalea pollutisoli TaxID=3034143 RepID=UPI0023EE2309|nr:CDP-alcohol phosphatidyltransferase family protein [Paraflavitalea sp. H1-2-19X]
MEKIKRSIPFALILFRLLLAPVMLLWTVQTHQSGWFLVACLWAGLLSDIFDGIIARNLGVADNRLRKWDGNVDIVFWLAAGVCVWILNGQLMKEHIYWIVALFVLEPISDLINFVKFRKSGCAHNWTSKTWGLFLLVTFTSFFAGQQPVVLFRICLALGLVSQLDRIIISSLLPKPECDIPSCYHAWLRRQGKTFKRYKLFN